MSEVEVNRALGARIKLVRELRGMTQAQVVKSYKGKSVSAQSMYESGDRGISVYRLLQLSEILRIAPSAWLLSDDGWGHLMSKVFDPTPPAPVGAVGAEA